MEFLQNVSLGEYGSGWEWDSTWPKVFDYEHVGISEPMKYSNLNSKSLPLANDNWIDYGLAKSEESNSICISEITEGQILASNSVMIQQISCTAHAFNSGNYYNFPAISAKMSDPSSRSICPNGWRLPQYNQDMGYSYLFGTYGVGFSNSTSNNYTTAAVNLPFSYVAVGYYDSAKAMFGRERVISLRMSSKRIMLDDFSSNGFSVDSPTNANCGFPVRCVSR